MTGPLADAWHANADRWVAWAREPGHDSYWRFHRKRFLQLVPRPGRLTVDIGCGEGRVGRDLQALGHTVIGIDVSIRMAQACASHPAAHSVAVGDATTLPVRSGAADLAIGFMSFHDVDDLDGAVDEAARILQRGGRLHLAIVHPINSAGAFQPADDAASLPFVIDAAYTEPRRYADEVERDGLTMGFHSWHRPLSHYTGSLHRAGFVIEVMEEVTDPDPSDTWSRIPLFLHVIARRDGR